MKEPHASPAWAERRRSMGREYADAFRDYWNYPARADKAPLRDDEIDPRRAPRRNDAINSILLASLWTVSVFWHSLYVEVFTQTNLNAFQVSYRFDLANAGFWAFVVGLVAFAVPYGLRRLTLATARRRRGDSMSRRARFGFAIFEGVLLGVVTFWTLDRPLWTDQPLQVIASVVTGLVGGVAALILLRFYKDIPPMPSEQ